MLYGDFARKTSLGLNGGYIIFQFTRILVDCVSPFEKKYGDNRMINVIYSFQNQDVISRETIELIAQQTATTQLVILLVIVIAVGGAIAFFTLRGGLAVFKQQTETFKDLSKAIDNLATIETQRHKTQKDLIIAIDNLNENNNDRIRKVDSVFVEVTTGLDNVSQKLDELQELLKDNPKDHQKMYVLMRKLIDVVQKAKEQTDEFEAIEDA